MKVALITGGSRGIGRGIVEAFAAADYAVGFTYTQNKGAADELVERLSAEGRKVAAYQADAKDYARAEEVICQARQELGPISTLVNNAGIKNDTAFHKMTPALWQEVIDTNLGGTFNYSRIVIGEMIRSGGSIINVSSVSGTVGIPGQVNYSASKAGMIGMTKALAKEMARFGVRVNAIAPGYIDTDMTATIEPERRQKLYATIPMRRAGTSKEVASLAVYLASDDASYVTGQVWIMDGGLT